jgi:hypothetical protein
LGQNQAAYQLDFVDLGLMPAIEREVELKLDVLLDRVVRHLLAAVDDGAGEEAVFRTTFRLWPLKSWPIAAIPMLRLGQLRPSARCSMGSRPITTYIIWAKPAALSCPMK